VRIPFTSVTSMLVLIFGMGGAVAQERPHDGALCQNAAAPVAAAKADLARSPESLAARFKLADALVEANCYDAAVHTLEDGEALHPRSAELAAKLRTTRSLVNEQAYFAGKEEAEMAAKVSRNLLRCSKLGDLNACDEALKLKPHDVEILLGKGDALLKASRPAEAEQVYRRAKQVAPDNARAATQFTAAQTQRQSALSLCQKGSGDDALQACQGALLPGSDDEFVIHSRMALLYQQRNQPAPALASYIAANAVKPGDRGVALGIVALTDASPRNDAMALAARGSALLTLKRGQEAVAALRQAQSLSPALPEIRAQIAQAQKLAATGSARVAPAGVSPPGTGSAAVAQVSKYSNAAEASRSH
jgi:tetratricopeptide (TPR) repeat protein